MVPFRLAWVFLFSEGSWAYHHPIGYFYVHPDGLGWFLVLGSQLESWCGQNPKFHGFIVTIADWDYLMVLPDGINVFDLQSRRWRRRE